MTKFNLNKTGIVIGIISVIIFLICTVWGAILTTQVLKDLHLQLLQIVYPGFAMTIGGIVIGFIEAFVYGWVFGAILAWLLNKLKVCECSK